MVRGGEVKILKQVILRDWLNSSGELLEIV